jgi:hypothetical protein
MKTLKELASDALSVQNACNLSGVVISFAQVIRDLKDNLPKSGSEEINQHPIIRLWVDKIASLAGLDQGVLSKEYQAVHIIAEFGYLGEENSVNNK